MLALQKAWLPLLHSIARAITTMFLCHRVPVNIFNCQKTRWHCFTNLHLIDVLQSLNDEGWHHMIYESLQRVL